MFSLADIQTLCAMSVGINTDSNMYVCMYI